LSDNLMWPICPQLVDQLPLTGEMERLKFFSFWPGVSVSKSKTPSQVKHLSYIRSMATTIWRWCWQHTRLV